MRRRRRRGGEEEEGGGGKLVYSHTDIPTIYLTVPGKIDYLFQTSRYWYHVSWY